MSKKTPPPLPPNAADNSKTSEPDVMASLIPTGWGLLDGTDEVADSALNRNEQEKIKSIVERIQVGDSAEGEAAVRDLLEIIENRHGGRANSSITQKVRMRMRELDARQGVYLTASGTLTQFNAILAAVHGAAITTVETSALKTTMAAALVSHVVAAFFLCWAGRPMDGGYTPTALMALTESHNHTNDTFRNYRRGWRMTLTALAVSAAVALLFLLHASSVTF